MSHKNEKKLRQATRKLPVNFVSPEAQLIINERLRQVQEEGYEASHDDQHVKGEIAIAALCYAQAARENSSTPSTWWPWDLKYWKPGNPTTPVDRERCLIKAGALIYAEIDRLNRVGVRIVDELKSLKRKG